jgi:regulator of protease activity HflC (stomatin/prohibitin superfamily)
MTNQHQNQFYRVAMLILSLALLTGCTTRIGPGMVGIEVDQSGSQRGVQDFTLKTGRVWYNPYSTSIIEYPTYMQTVVWTASTSEGHPVDESITFTGKGGIVYNADFNLSYLLDGEKVPTFYVKFRSDDLAIFTDGFMHNVARDCINGVAGNYEVEGIMGSNGPFIEASKACLSGTMFPFGVLIQQFGIIGAPRPPKDVSTSINMKVQATQLALQKQNEVAQAEAEARKAVAVAEGEGASLVARAKGEAEANRIKSSSIDDKLISWYKLNNQHDMIWRWDGQVSKVQTGNSGVLLQLPNQ